jgi:flagellar biosynthetic protein FliP
MKALLTLTLLLLAQPVLADSGFTLFTLRPGNGGMAYQIPADSLPFLLALPFMPALLLSFSAFTRIAVVFFLLRQGLGSQHAPPTLVLLGFALLLSFFVMKPVVETMQRDAWQPYKTGQLGAEAAAEAAAAPLKTFMLRQTRAADLSLFAKTEIKTAAEGERLPFSTVAPAFLTSELKTAFQVGFMIVLPFLVIDLVVASLLMGLGMFMVPPQMVSFPLKLLLFVLADGWHLLVGSLIAGF